MSRSLLTSYDYHLHMEGTFYQSYQKMGAHVMKQGGKTGVHFAVWAPNAAEVSVIGDWNEWKHGVNPMQMREDAGIWTCFIPNLQQGSLYKYSIVSKYNNFHTEKADPYAFATELVPQTASRIWEISGYEWKDSRWMQDRANANGLNAPINIYEVHAGSWKRKNDNQFLTYRELAVELAEYVTSMGYTHVEFLPLTEHPFYGSWGYQTVAYFAPTSRYGTPQDLMYLIDTLHQAGISVILDWVPAHFPRDGHGLGYFDGTHLYEHADPRKGLHVD